MLVRSAGTRARPGRPVHFRTERALERHGVAADGFQSRRLGTEDVDWADLILTMTGEHREEVVSVSPRGMQKVFTLLEAGGLCQTLQPEHLRGYHDERRGTVLADALRRARSSHARARGPAFDIVDPIEGPARLHVEVVDQIAATLQPLKAILAPLQLSETRRMPRLPPVPRST